MQVIQFGKDTLPDLEKSVVTIGSFDGVHKGHQKIFTLLKKKSKEIQGVSVVLSFTPHPRHILDPKSERIQLLSTQEEKIELIEQCGIDYFVIVPFTIEFAQIQPEEYVEAFLIKHFKPTVVIIGYDHKFGVRRSGTIHLLREYEKNGAFQIVEIDKQELDSQTISSTKIREAIQNKDLQTAALLSGRFYYITGVVERGLQVGTGLGYPTANLKISSKEKLIPGPGVYAAFVNFNGKRHGAMLYIGNRPTIGQALSQTIELHIFDFNESIYGKTLRVDIVEFIREDAKFENLEELKSQIHSDELIIKEKLNKSQFKFVPKQVLKTAVVILNYNGIAYLQEYIKDSLKYLYPHCEIYVIDNQSEDESVNWLQRFYPEVKIIRLSKNYGFAEGYNRGLAQIDADYFVVLNSDVHFTSDWVSPIIKAFDQDSSLLAAQPKILDLKEPTKFEYAGAAGGYMDYFGFPFCRGRVIQHKETDKGQYDSTEEIFWASGAAMIVRASMFKAIGGFDVDYFAHQEEIDYCWRIKRTGGKVLCFPKESVYHLGGGTLNYEHPLKLYLNFRNNLMTIIKNERLLKLLWLLPARFVIDVGIMVQFLLSGNYKGILSVLKSGFYILWNIPELIRKKSYTHNLVSTYRFGDSRSKIGRIPKFILVSYYLFGKKLFSDYQN